MIPKIIHYVWVGPAPIPDEDQARITRWSQIMPDWQIRHWGNHNADYSSSFLRQAYSVRAWNRVSDYMRMYALCTEGGVYLDADVDIIKPLDPLLELDAFLGFQWKDDGFHDLVNGAIFGARQGHWLPTELRRHFDEVLDGRNDIGSFSGPGLISQILRQHGLSGYSETPVTVRDVTIFPCRYFYPYSWKEVYSESCIEADTYAVHRWAETWVAKRDWRRRMRKRYLKWRAKLFPRTALDLAKRFATGG